MGRDAFDELDQSSDAGPHDYMQRAQEAKRIWEESYLWSRPKDQPSPPNEQAEEPLGEQDEDDQE